jgi:hypothetical protein
MPPPGKSWFDCQIALVTVLAVSFALFTDWENRRLATVQNLLASVKKSVMSSPHSIP